MFELKFPFVHWVFHDLNSTMEACETLAAISPCNPVTQFSFYRWANSLHPNYSQDPQAGEKNLIRDHLLVQPVVSVTIISDPISRIWTNSTVLSIDIILGNSRWWDKNSLNRYSEVIRCVMGRDWQNVNKVRKRVMRECCG